MLRSTAMIMIVLLAGVIGLSTLWIFKSCHAPSAKADAYLVELAGLIEIGNADMERLLERCTAGEAMHAADICPVGGR